MDEQIFGAVVGIVSAKLDAVIETRDGFHLQREVELELLGNFLADGDLTEALYVGHAFEKEDPFDELVGVFHLVNRLFANSLGEAMVTPIFAHLGVKKVLIDGGKLAGENVVQ